MLGTLLSLLSAISFAFNSVTARRGMLTGNPTQAMAISVPLGVLCFALVGLVMGGLGRIADLAPTTIAWLCAHGIIHFIVGRYGNYRASQLAGNNLTAPVMQLNLVVTLVLAVVVLGESCTVLQAIGGALILAGSIITQRQAARPKGDATVATTGTTRTATFTPRVLGGYLFALLAAGAYGVSPIIARHALAGTTSGLGIIGGLIAYCSATTLIVLAFLAPTFRRNVQAMRAHDAKWFAWSGLSVAAAQGFFFAAIAVAPIMLVSPLVQMSMVFLLLMSHWMNPQHEVMGPLVMLGVGISIVGALAVSINTATILAALRVPEAVAQVLGIVL